MKKTRAVITGIGVIAPQCNDVKQLWSAINMRNVKTDFKPALNGYSASVDAKQFDLGMPIRSLRKIDRFSHLGLTAAVRALEDAGLCKDDIDPYETGVMVGNCFGGWEFTDRELRNFHQENNTYRSISPFQATAWFPAAVQGQISLYLGLKGYSKTYMCCRASSLVSLGNAARLIEQNKASCIIAGGVESIDTDFIYAALRSGPNVLSSSNECNPFSEKSDGYIPSEGSCFLVLESEEEAIRRGKRPYAVIDGFSQCTDAMSANGLPSSASTLRTTMHQVAREDNVDAVVADAMGNWKADRQEREDITEMFGKCTPIIETKSAFGQMFGASGAMDVSCAALMLQRHFVHELNEKNVNIDKADVVSPLKRVLVNARGLNGETATIGLRAIT